MTHAAKTNIYLSQYPNSVLDKCKSNPDVVQNQPLPLVSHPCSPSTPAELP